MEKRLNTEDIAYLARGFLTLETQDECIRFLQDLCTVSELNELARRFQAAKMLKSGVIYTEIAKETGLSTATISRVNRCLKSDTSGYFTVLERLAHRR